MTQLEAAEGRVVGIYYTLKDSEDNVLDTNRSGGDPLAYLHGAQNIVKGLENALAGKVKDDFVDVVVDAAEGYGERQEDLVKPVERSNFPADGEPEAGMMVHGQNEHGQHLQGVIVGVDGENVTVDFNHPLAGQSLHFEVTVTGVREATAEEVTHGHPHGPGGHEH